MKVKARNDRTAAVDLSWDALDLNPDIQMTNTMRCKAWPKSMTANDRSLFDIGFDSEVRLCINGSISLRFNYYTAIITVIILSDISTETLITGLAMHSLWTCHTNVVH